MAFKALNKKEKEAIQQILDMYMEHEKNNCEEMISDTTDLCNCNPDEIEPEDRPEHIYYNFKILENILNRAS